MGYRTQQTLLWRCNRSTKRRRQMHSSAFKKRNCHCLSPCSAAAAYVTEAVHGQKCFSGKKSAFVSNKNSVKYLSKL